MRMGGRIEDYIEIIEIIYIYIYQLTWKIKTLQQPKQKVTEEKKE